jgi:hypothetical protein
MESRTAIERIGNWVIERFETARSSGPKIRHFRQIPYTPYNPRLSNRFIALAGSPVPTLNPAATHARHGTDVFAQKGLPTAGQGEPG